MIIIIRYRGIIPINENYLQFAVCTCTVHCSLPTSLKTISFSAFQKYFTATRYVILSIGCTGTFSTHFAYNITHI